MSTPEHALETRIAIIEYETRATRDRLDREVATNSDISDMRAELSELRAEMYKLHASTIRWVLGTPAIYLAVIVGGFKVLELIKTAGYLH